MKNLLRTCKETNYLREVGVYLEWWITKPNKFKFLYILYLLLHFDTETERWRGFGFEWGIRHTVWWAARRRVEASARLERVTLSRELFLSLRLLLLLPMPSNSKAEGKCKSFREVDDDDDADDESSDAIPLPNQDYPFKCLRM